MPHSHQLNMFSIMLSNNVRHDKNINCISGLGSTKFVGGRCQHNGMILPSPCTAFSRPSRSIHFGDVCKALLFRFFASLFKAFRQWRTTRSKESMDVKAWLNFWEALNSLGLKRCSHVKRDVIMNSKGNSKWGRNGWLQLSLNHVQMFVKRY